MFIRESWYVLGWARDLDEGHGLLGRTIIGEPVVVWRDTNGDLHAMEDRCPHRHAPLSRGRIEGNTLRCMYHGMAFGTDGHCVHMPLLETPPDAQVRVYPVIEKNSWIWIWMGSEGQGDVSLIPDAFGLDNPMEPMRAGSIEYDAHYQLIHDNLCDLSHLDFVHATTLQPATGAFWAETAPRIRKEGRALRFERWFENAELPNAPNRRTDAWVTYDFALPGIFILRGARYPAGTAARFDYRMPEGIEPLGRNIEQQAVTPISETRTAYHFATGLIGNSPEATILLSDRMDIVMAAFGEDREMIEAQQRIWDLTDIDKPKVFVPQDQGPFLMRQMIQKEISKQENSD